MESGTRIEQLNALGNPVYGLTWASDRRGNEKHVKGYNKPEVVSPPAARVPMPAYAWR